MRIGITMFSQLLLVPIYLSYWDVKTYGVWIATQALVSVLSTLNQGHQTYLEFEFLKQGKDKPAQVSFTLWSGFWVALILGSIEVLSVIGLIVLGAVGGLLETSNVMDSSLIFQAQATLLLQMISWMLITSLGGLFVRVLSPFGYYPRMSWWGVWAAILTAGVPVIAVSFGANLLQAGIALVAATIMYAIPQYYDIYRLLKREGLLYKGSSLKSGLKNLRFSLIISARSLLENARQQGVRVILAPLSGATALVAFSTMRTGANIVLQGLNTITSPLMPELMRFLNKKDQDRTEASFGTVWFVVLTLLAPGVLILQWCVEPLYIKWTKGLVEFNPILFALLSLGVLVFAVAQPAMAVMRGNNLVRSQFLITLIAAIIVVGGMFILVPMYGITGAGISLLSAEIAATTGYRIVAKNWLKKNGLEWPQKSSRIALTGVWITALAMFGMIQFHSLRGFICIGGLLLLFIATRLYWKSSPLLVREKASKIFARIPGVTKMQMKS